MVVRRLPTVGDVAAPLEPAQAVTLAQAGDLTAFEWLVRHLSTPVYGFLVRWLSSTAAAEDVFQEACLRAYHSIHKARPDAFKAWFFRIAINEAKKHVRTADRADRRERAVGVEWDASTTPRSEDQLHATDMLERGLQEVSAEHRQVLLLRFVEEMSHADIGRALGVPAFVVKMRVSRARKAFAQAVARLEGSPR